MRIEVVYRGPEQYEASMAEQDEPEATVRLRTYASVAEVDAGIRADIERAQAWGRLKLPIPGHGPEGELDPIPEDLRRILAEITRKAEAAGSIHRPRR